MTIIDNWHHALAGVCVTGALVQQCQTMWYLDREHGELTIMHTATELTDVVLNETNYQSLPTN